MDDEEAAGASEAAEAVRAVAFERIKDGLFSIEGGRPRLELASRCLQILGVPLGAWDCTNDEAHALQGNSADRLPAELQVSWVLLE